MVSMKNELEFCNDLKNIELNSGLLNEVKIMDTVFDVLGVLNLESGALSEKELCEFYKNGLLGPFDSPFCKKKLDDMFLPTVKAIKSKEQHTLYGRFSVRDWHLVEPDICQLISEPSVLIKLKQILGDDLILWRSKIFHKRSGDGPIDWHQEWGAFNGEEIGNDKPSLLPFNHLSSGYWNLTVWIAMQDVTLDMGPMQFVKESYKTRYPIEMIPMTDSAFWQDPFLDIHNKHELVTLCNSSLLILDIDSSKFLDGIDINLITFDELKAYIFKKFESLKAAITLDFDINKKHLITLPMKKGQYVIFPERTMHRSISNVSQQDRFGINFRITTSDTLVYPSRLEGDFIDGSNVDISNHKCVLLSGNKLQKNNVY